MKQVVYTVLLLAALSNGVVAQETPIFPKGEISKADGHTGAV